MIVSQLKEHIEKRENLEVGPDHPRRLRYTTNGDARGIVSGCRTRNSDARRGTSLLFLNAGGEGKSVIVC